MKIGPRYKIARRLGPIYEKTQTAKFALRESRRGRKEYKHPKVRTDFGNQLIEKQKARFTYGVSERQFQKYVNLSMAEREKKATDALYERLESRLDNVIYRLGFAPTRAAARQMVAHGHILIKGRRVTIPSLEMKVGDKVSIRVASSKKPLFANMDEKLKNVTPPSWIKFNSETKEAEIQGIPKVEVGKVAFNLGGIMEFYSR